MGLRNKEIKKLELRLELLEFLKEYGIEPNDLHYLHEAIEYVKEKKSSNSEKIIESVTSPDNRSKVLDDETMKKIKEANANKLTPEDFIQQFAGESEEFYPYGKPKKNN